MNKSSTLLIRLTEENKNYLDELNRKTKIPKNKLVNIILSEMDKEVIELLPDVYEEEDTQVRFRLTQSEVKFLDSQKNKSGASSLTSEIKYRLLNSIYANKFYTNNEMKELTKASFELSMVGRNLNQILKQLYTREELKDYSTDIKETVLQVQEKIKNLSKELDKIKIHTEQRL